MSSDVPAASSEPKIPESETHEEPIKFVKPPHPSWQPGDKMPAPFSSEDMFVLDPSTATKPTLYNLMVSGIVPRPVAFVSTVDSKGNQNLAPYSYFNGMSHDPPVICIGCNRSSARKGEKKDTLLNIEETGEFVVNIISDWFIEAASYTSGDFERGVDELSLVGLTPIPSLKVKAPRIAESALQMECKVIHTYDINGRDGKNTSTVVIAEVLLFHIANHVKAPGPPTKPLQIDPVKLRPVSRLGGATFGLTSTLFDIPRPEVGPPHAGHGPPAAAPGAPTTPPVAPAEAAPPVPPS